MNFETRDYNQFLTNTKLDFSKIILKFQFLNKLKNCFLLIKIKYLEINNNYQSKIYFF